jgi:hypothetical protein
MNKLIEKIKSTPLNPVWIIIFFIIVGGLNLIIMDADDKSMNVFLTFIGLGISAAVAQCAIIQNAIQRDNIKIQLFDKRYKVYQSVLNTITIIKRDNWDRYILFNGNDINQQFFLFEEELYKSANLSLFLFDNDVYLKLKDINNSFDKVAKAYKNMCIANAQSIQSDGRTSEYILLFQQFLASRQNGSVKYENELKDKFPKEYIAIMEFSKECDSYLSVVEKSKILIDIGKYIKVDNLDK